VPARPGITNALGCVVADLRHDFVRTVNTPLDVANMDQMHAILAEQATAGTALIEWETVPVEQIDVLVSADMQFVGQTHLLRVALPDITPDRDTVQRLFEQAYHTRFHVDLPEIRAQLVNLNVSVIGRRPPVDLSALIDPTGRAATLDAAKTGMRDVVFENRVQTPIYSRERLPLDAQIIGPAILEQMDTTVVVEPGDRVSQDADGNLIIKLSS